LRIIIIFEHIQGHLKIQPKYEDNLPLHLIVNYNKKARAIREKVKVGIK